MRSSSGLAIGLAVGLVVGASGMYLALERPWTGGDQAVAEAPPDAGAAPAEAAAKPKKKRRGRRDGGAGEQRVDVDETITLSDADRKMVWKGDSVEVPPAQLDLGAGGEGRALTSQEIRATIDADAGPLQQCVVRALGGAPFSGEVTVKVLVDGQGRVTRTRVHAPAFMHEAGVLGCARGAAKRMGFPATGGFTQVTIPFPIDL